LSIATDVVTPLQLYRLPFFELLYRAHTVHLCFHDAEEIQRCVLLSIKTGGCPEDCGYCSQSANHKTDLKRQALLSVEEVRASALQAREQGAQRFCMGRHGAMPRMANPSSEFWR
jgi:biotin synthase